jgi:serine/threonine protein phosphatase PrpC
MSSIKTDGNTEQHAGMDSDRQVLGAEGRRLKVLEDIEYELLKKRAEKEQKYFDISLSGTTATLVIQLPRKIIIGYVGDSKVSIQQRDSVNTKTGFLTDYLHSPAETEETIRIYNNRGELRQNNIDKKCKIYVRARMYPGLPISRSLGDLLAHKIGVTSEPNVRIHEITPNDKFMTIATDGVWRYLNPDDIGEIVAEFGRDAGASNDLIYKRVNENCANEGHEIDDCSCILSYLSNTTR